MKKLLVILVCLLIPAFANAVAYTSSGNGDWDNVATWGGGGFPTAADTAVIAAGHEVTVKGTEEVGASPVGVTTYNLDITGTLIFENAAADSILNVYTSIRVNSGGKIEMGTAASPMNCAGSARLTMKTSAASKKYNIYLNQGTLEAHGCKTYHGASATVTRARIASCAPDCTAGARTVTLDATTNWVASSGWAGDGIIFGVGGNETTYPAAGDDPEIITTWTVPAGNQVAVTFVENHMVGDIVEITRRNVLLDADSVTYHPVIYTSSNFNDPYSLSYVAINEFGDAASANVFAINQNSATYSLGSIDYVAVTNAHDGAASGCFYLLASGWTSFEGNTCFDAGDFGRSYQLGADTRVNTPVLEFKNNSAYGSSNGNPQCAYNTTTQPVDYDGFWMSHCLDGIYHASVGSSVIKNCLIHGTTGDGLDLVATAGYFPTAVVKIHDNEIRNGMGTGAGIMIALRQALIYNNDLDNIPRAGVWIKNTTATRNHTRMHDNTYDNCNSSAYTVTGAVYIDSSNGTVRMDNEEFGQSDPNHYANIAFSAAGSAGTYVNAVCNNCLLADPTAPDGPWGSMPADGYFPSGCNGACWDDINRISENTTYTFHNKDQVEDAHLGWGPGGMVFERQTGVVYTTSNLKMKLTPLNSTDYSYLKLGSVYADAGATVTVNVYLRKDEAVATAGRRPRLALQGLGFVREDDYDEMSDVTNTWEQVTVTGVADWKGVVHIFVGVMGVMDGANGYQPKWPPTLDVYVDGASYTK